MFITTPLSSHTSGAHKPNSKAASKHAPVHAYGCWLYINHDGSYHVSGPLREVVKYVVHLMNTRQVAKGCVVLEGYTLSSGKHRTEVYTGRRFPAHVVNQRAVFRVYKNGRVEAV